MKGQSVRVIVASEYPEVQHFLKGVVEQEGEVVTVGQAQDASKAVTMARNLGPNVAIIDSDLPHAIGLDAVPLSRIGGLDTAQIISEEISNTRVMLVSNLGEKVLLKHGLGPDVVAFFSRERMGATIPLALQDLCHEAVQPNALVFASVETKPRLSLRRKNASLSDKAIFFGGLGIVVGWFLTITIMFAPAGAFLALAGVATVFFGLVGKLTAPLGRRLLRRGARL